MLKSGMSSLYSLLGRWRETATSVQKKRILILLLIVLYISPLWIFKYFQSQDGAAHVYNAYALRVFHDEGSTLLREYFKLNLTLFPNWLAHVCMSLLMYIFPPLIAEKILLSAIIGLFPLSFFYFLDSAHKGKSLYGFLGFLFADSYLLHMGFYSFALSVPLFFFALGYFIKHKEDMRVNRIAILYLFCILIFFCHILSYALLILSLTLLSITSFYRRPKQIVQLLLCMLPLYFIMANYLLSTEVGQASDRMNIRWERLGEWKAWDYLLSAKMLMFFTSAHLIPTRLMSVLVGLLFVATLYKRIRQRKIMNQDNQFLLLSGVFTFFYFIMPWGIGTGSFITARVPLFIIPVLLPFLSEDFHKYVRNGIVSVIVILSIAHLAISYSYYYPLDKGMKEYTSGVHLIEKNKTVLGLSSNFRPGVKEVPSITHQPYFHIKPFCTAIDYYCLRNNGVSLTNYEAKFDYFPLNWRTKHSGTIDYIVAWKLDMSNVMWGESDPIHGLDYKGIADSLETDYELIHSTENLQVYRHRAEQPKRAE